MCERNPDGEWWPEAWARNRLARAAIERGMTKQELAVRLTGAEYRREMARTLAAGVAALGPGTPTTQVVEAAMRYEQERERAQILAQLAPIDGKPVVLPSSR